MAVVPLQPRLRHTAIAAAKPADKRMIVLAQSGAAMEFLWRNEDGFI
jgi:hypothetical protein